MKLIFDKIIQKDSDTDRNTLLSLSKEDSPNYIGSNINVVYIYSLVESEIPYPQKSGNTLYIGEANRATSTGLRFPQHISHKKDIGSNSNVNYCLNSYYWNGNKINLKIYDLGPMTNKERKEYESFLIKCHVKKYGATPIAQGSSGYKISETNKIDLSISNNIF